MTAETPEPEVTDGSSEEAISNTACTLLLIPLMLPVIMCLAFELGVPFAIALFVLLAGSIGAGLLLGNDLGTRLTFAIPFALSSLTSFFVKLHLDNWAYHEYEWGNSNTVLPTLAALIVLAVTFLLMARFLPSNAKEEEENKAEEGDEK